MPTFTFVCREADSQWSAKQVNTYGLDSSWLRQITNKWDHWRQITVQRGLTSTAGCINFVSLPQS